MLTSSDPLDSKVSPLTEKPQSSNKTPVRPEFHLSQIRELTPEELEKIDFQNIKHQERKDLEQLTVEQKEWLFHLVENSNQTPAGEQTTFLQYLGDSLRDILDQKPSHEEYAGVEEILHHPKIKEAYQKALTSKETPSEKQRREESLPQSSATKNGASKGGGISSAFMRRSNLSLLNLFEQPGAETLRAPEEFSGFLKDLKKLDLSKLPVLNFKDLKLDLSSVLTPEEMEELSKRPFKTREKYLSDLFEQKYEEFQSSDLQQSDSNGVGLLKYLKQSLAELGDIRDLYTEDFAHLLNHPEFQAILGESDEFKALLRSMYPGLLPEGSESDEVKMQKLLDVEHEMENAQKRMEEMDEKITQFYRHEGDVIHEQEERINRLFEEHGGVLDQFRNSLPSDDLSTEDITTGNTKETKAEPWENATLWGGGWGLDSAFLTEWLAFGKPLPPLTQEEINDHINDVLEELGKMPFSSTYDFAVIASLLGLPVSDLDAVRERMIEFLNLYNTNSAGLNEFVKNMIRPPHNIAIQILADTEEFKKELEKLQEEVAEMEAEEKQKYIDWGQSLVHARNLSKALQLADLAGDWKDQSIDLEKLVVHPDGSTEIIIERKALFYYVRDDLGLHPGHDDNVEDQLRNLIQSHENVPGQLYHEWSALNIALPQKKAELAKLTFIVNNRATVDGNEGLYEYYERTVKQYGFDLEGSMLGSENLAIALNIIGAATDGAGVTGQTDGVFKSRVLENGTYKTVTFTTKVADYLNSWVPVIKLDTSMDGLDNAATLAQRKASNTTNVKSRMDVHGNKVSEDQTKLNNQYGRFTKFQEMLSQITATALETIRGIRFA